MHQRAVFVADLLRPPAGDVRIKTSMTAEIKKATRLQSLDLRIGELQREVAALPKHIALIEKALDSHLRRLEADRAALAANQKERKRLEDDIKVQEQKVSKLKDQMLQAKTNEQYRAFQHEIEFCETEIRKFEDKILDLMGESEPLDINVKKAEAALKEEKKQVEAEKDKARDCTAVDQKQLSELEAERKAIVTGMKPQVYSAYERIRKKWHGVAVAEATEGRCGACQISLRPQFYQDLRKGEQLMFCESCGRILYYNPPVSFEADLAAAPHA
jgi:predicted  nucleic acid-binding Zn-ribbon protein